MKKLFLLGALFAAGLTFTACSDKDAVVDETKPADNPGGTNYLALSINLPTDPASTSRAATTDNNGNVTYDDGLETEYAVQDATLIIFDGSSNNFKAAYNLSMTTTDFTKVTTSNNVTEANTNKKVLQVGNSIAAGDLALVVLNKKDIFTNEDGNNIKFKGESANFSGSFSDFQGMTAKTAVTAAEAKANTAAKVLADATSIFMTNAILANKQGSTTAEPTGVAYRTLVPISTIYKTEEEAKNTTSPDQIYVERAVAKVTVGGSDGNFSTSKVDGSNLSYKISGWTLDNTAAQSYLVRKEPETTYAGLHSWKNGNNVYRTIGNTAINYPTTPEYFYRTYFAQSWNFDKTETDGITHNNEFTFYNQTGTDKPLYCYENTFAVANQVKKYTTLVQLQVTAGDGSTDYYTVGGNKTKVYTATTLQTLLQTATYNYLLAKGNVKTAEAALASVTLASTNLTITIETSPSDVNNVQITGVTASSNSTYYNFTNDATLWNAIKNEVGTIVLYKNGVSYYTVLIHHFGDKLTPWSEWENTSDDTASPKCTAPTSYTSEDDTQAKKIAKLYPATQADNNYLGRYGVLRNNWYHINVGSIRYLGDAKPQTDAWPDTPDDEFESYITFQINVLSWAKRQQDADL